MSPSLHWFADAASGRETAINLSLILLGLGLTLGLIVFKKGLWLATIFGCDLGPNLTTVGSLATVLWLLILRQRNIEVTGLDYFKVGILVTPLMLVVGALAIWLLRPVLLIRPPVSDYL